MPFESWSLFAMVAGWVVIAGIIKGFAGFGLAMVAGPLLAVVVGPVHAVVIVLLLEILTGLQLLRRALVLTDWQVVVPLTVASAVTMPLGALALVNLDPLVMRRAIAAMALLFAIVLFSGWRYRGGHRLWLSGAIGSASGAITGATGMGNPILVLYVLASGIAERNRASLLTMVTMMIALAIVTLGFTGVLNWTALGQGLFLLPFAVVGAITGARLFGHASEAAYRRGALAIIVVAALVALVY